MIFVDDGMGAWLVADSRRAIVDALLEHLGDEPELWQVQRIAAACLGHREPAAVSIVEM